MPQTQGTEFHSWSKAWSRWAHCMRREFALQTQGAEFHSVQVKGLVAMGALHAPGVCSANSRSRISFGSGQRPGRDGRIACAGSLLCKLKEPNSIRFTSGRRELNPRPLRPERSALPSCATARSGTSAYCGHEAGMPGAPVRWTTSLSMRRRSMLRTVNSRVSVACRSPAWGMDPDR